MAQEIVGFKIKIDGKEQVVGSIGEMRKLLKEANFELLAAQKNFGEYSKQAVAAAKKVAELKDTIQEAGETSQLFDPGKKFQAFAGSLSAVAGGFSAVQGAMGLFGSETQNVEKAMMRVQSAMALTQGLNVIRDSAKDFKRLGAVIKESTLFQKANNAATSAAVGIQKAFGVATAGAGKAFNALKVAIAATGIGALVVALGVIVGYWDKIKGAITGVSSEQTKLLNDSQKNVKSEQEKLDAIGNQENILKLQGKSEEDILKIKIAQTDQVIAATKENIKQQIIVTKAQVEAEKRNKAILQGLLKFVTAPLQLLIDGVAKVAEFFGAGFEFNIAESVAGAVFDPEEVAAKGEETTKELQNQLANLENAQAGNKLALKGINDKANQKSKADADKANEERLQANKEANKRLLELQQQYSIDIIKDENERAKKQLQIEKQREIDAINATKADKEVKDKLIAQINETYRLKEQKRQEEADANEKKRVQEFEDELNNIRLETKLAGIKDAREKEGLELDKTFQDRKAAILANEELTEVERQQLLDALDEQYREQKKAKQQTYAEEDAIKELDALNKIIGDEDMKYEAKKAALDKERILLEDMKAKGLITEEQYVERKKELAKKEEEIDTKKKEALMANAEAISGLLGNLSNLFGKQTAAGKAFAVAQAVIDTYLSANKAYASLSGIPVVGPALGAVAAGVAVASGIKNVKEILKVKVPGTGGGGTNVSAPNIQAPIAPQQPQAQLTQLDQATINRMGSATNRSYVVESDVTDSQERIRRINRAARLT
jgi:hypothetical protein